MQEIIELKNITQKYDNKIILKDINLSILNSQSIAFTGHNGAGKSTLLKIIAKVVEPTFGEVNYNEDLLFHYVPEHFPKMSITAREYLTYMGKMDDLKCEEIDNRLMSLGKDFFLAEMMDTPMKHLSKGSLQKIGIVQSLLRQPDVLILDEPLSGQDMDSQSVFIHKMNMLKKAGVVIIMSCHEPFLIDSISDIIYQIDEMKVIQCSFKPYQKREFFLWFDKLGNAEIPEIYQNRVKYWNDKYQMKVEETESNAIIVNMIQQGWKLSGMEDADDERFG